MHAIDLLRSRLELLNADAASRVLQRLRELI